MKIRINGSDGTPLPGEMEILDTADCAIAGTSFGPHQQYKVIDPDSGEEDWICGMTVTVTAETSTQQRPWWQVAPFPGPNDRGEWDDPETYESGCRAHYAAMTLAYSKALGAAILAARTPEDSAQLRATLFLPMTAAFTAAASLDSGEDWTINRIRDLLADPGDVADFCHDWLANSGIDPDEIAATL